MPFHHKGIWPIMKMGFCQIQYPLSSEDQMSSLPTSSVPISVSLWYLLKCHTYAWDFGKHQPYLPSAGYQVNCH